MSQAYATDPHVLLWERTRAPIEPLLAEVSATLSELEQDAGPTRLNMLDAVDEIRNLAEQLGDLVFDSSCRLATQEDLRAQAVAGAVAYLRFVRDVCGKR